MTQDGSLPRATVPLLMVGIILSTAIGGARTAGAQIGAPPAAVRKISGDGQSGDAFTTLPAPLVVRVTDANGRPVRGVPVKWATAGGGRLKPSSRVTSRNGLAWARWVLGPSAELQVATAIVSDLLPADFYAAVPVASVSMSRDSMRLWTGDIAQLDVILRDASGNTLSGGGVTWSSADTRVANVSGAGLVTALGAGSTTVVARVGSRAASAKIVALPVLQGQLLSPDGSAVAGLRLFARTRAGTDSLDITPSGRFALRLPRPIADTVEVYVDAIEGWARRYYPSLVRMPATELRRELRIVLVPTRWTLRAGSYAGSTVDIRMAAALDRTQAGSSFWRVAFAPSRASTNVVGWPAASFPIAVAFRRSAPRRPISRADSIAFWTVIQSLEQDFGVDLFRPARYEELAAGTVGITVDINPAITSDGFTFITWADNGTIYDGSVTVRAADLLGEPSVVIHEMLHALGFGHTRSWFSALSAGGRNPPRVTRDDVAYAQIIYSVRNTQTLYRARYGIMEAFEAERRVAGR